MSAKYANIEDVPEDVRKQADAAHLAYKDAYERSVDRAALAVMSGYEKKYALALENALTAYVEYDRKLRTIGLQARPDGRTVRPRRD